MERASGFRRSVVKYSEEGTAGRKHGTFPRNGRAGRVEAPLVGTRTKQGKRRVERGWNEAGMRWREPLMRLDADGKGESA